MPHDALPLQYAQESKPTGVTALSRAGAMGLLKKLRLSLGQMGHKMA